MNFLGNTWKYTSTGIRRNGRGGAACPLRQAQRGRLRLAYREKLFDTYQVLHGEEFEGASIGLATVKRIVERHRCTVWGESKIEKGATCYFIIP